MQDMDTGIVYTVSVLGFLAQQEPQTCVKDAVIIKLMQKEQQEQTFFFLPRKQLILPSVTTVGSPTNSISLAQPFSENKHAVCTWRVKHRIKPSPNSCHLLIGAGTFYTLYFAKYKKKCSFKKIDRTWQSCRGEVISTQPFVRERFQYNTCNLKIHAIFQYIHGM